MTLSISNMRAQCALYSTYTATREDKINYLINGFHGWVNSSEEEVQKYYQENVQNISLDSLDDIMETQLFIERAFTEVPAMGFAYRYKDSHITHMIEQIAHLKAWHLFKEHWINLFMFGITGIKTWTKDAIVDFYSDHREHSIYKYTPNAQDTLVSWIFNEDPVIDDKIPVIDDEIPLPFENLHFVDNYENTTGFF